MALDRSVVLRSGLPGIPVGELTRLVARELERYGPTSLLRLDARASARPVDAVIRPLRPGGEAGNLAIYIPRGAFQSIPSIADQLIRRVRSPYAVLDDHGILLINSTTTTVPGRITLAGGSHCTVSLEQRRHGWAVVKTVAKNDQGGNADSLHRHQNEAEWLSAVSRVSSWFSAVESITDEESSFAFSSEFFPGYSAAELLLHGSLTGGSLANVLIRIYDELKNGFYKRKPVVVRWKDIDVTYVDKIRRRRLSLLEHIGETQPLLGALLTARRIQVNGHECLSLPALLDIVDSEPLWQPVVRPAARHACHGDLILEDILLDSGISWRPHSDVGSITTYHGNDPVPQRSRRKIKLIDPNPYNVNAIYDLAKTMLSLWLGYELVYFDMFHLSGKVWDRQDKVTIRISLAETRYQEELKVASARFMAYAQAELAAVCGLRERDFRRSVRMCPFTGLRPAIVRPRPGWRAWPVARQRQAPGTASVPARSGWRAA